LLCAFLILVLLLAGGSNKNRPKTFILRRPTTAKDNIQKRGPNAATATKQVLKIATPLGRGCECTTK
jgi:hypothetical protein